MNVQTAKEVARRLFGGRGGDAECFGDPDMPRRYRVGWRDPDGAADMRRIIPLTVYGESQLSFEEAFARAFLSSRDSDAPWWGRFVQEAVSG